MSSYVRLFKHPKYKVINHHRYGYIRSYSDRSDAQAEANRWNGEPGISAKVAKLKKQGHLSRIMPFNRGYSIYLK